MRNRRLLALFSLLAAAGCKRPSVPSEYADVVPTEGLETAVKGDGNPAFGDPPSLLLWYAKDRSFTALREAFAARLGKLDGELLLDCEDEGGFDLAIVRAPRYTTMVSGDAKRGFVTVIRADLTDVSGPPSGRCKLRPAAEKLCERARSTPTSCHLKQ